METLQIFNDPVHGSIQLHPLLVKIIDTPQFQRLRDIKQLGVSYWVYPGASHNKFEHCIGASYLCGQMIDKLRELHPDLVTPNDSLCIKIAGLCRDLGFGPFSHFFHKVLIPKLKRQPPHSESQSSSITQQAECQPDGLQPDWLRDASCKMFDFMLKENQELKNALDEDLEFGYDDFIKDLIRGKEPNENKAFLYEIVSNKRTRIDCNKFDYIARDCHNVGIQSNFNWQRYLQNIRIMKVNEELQRICVRDKEALNLYQLFHTRWHLYHLVYQHKTVDCIEDMLAEALLNAESKFKIAELLKVDGLLKEDDESMKCYTKLTDRIFYNILDIQEESSQSPLRSAKMLLQDIQQRKLYKFCGFVADPQHKDADPSQITDEIASKSNGKVNSEQIFVSVAYFHYGKEGDNPIDNVEFFNKSMQLQKFNTEQVSYMLPKTFHERFVRVYAKSNDHKKQVQDCFKEWCEEHGARCVLHDDKSGSTQVAQSGAGRDSEKPNLDVRFVEE